MLAACAYSSNATADKTIVVPDYQLISNTPKYENMAFGTNILL